MRYYWYGGEKYIRQMTKECVVCSHKNNLSNLTCLSPLRPIKVHPQIMWRIHCDLIGPFPESNSGNKYICVAICAFSKYVEAIGNSFFLKYLLFGKKQDFRISQFFRS